MRNIWLEILSLRRHTSRSEQSTTAQMSICLRKAQRRQKILVVKTRVSIYVCIVECRREITGLQCNILGTQRLWSLACFVLHPIQSLQQIVWCLCYYMIIHTHPFFMYQSSNYQRWLKVTTFQTDLNFDP